MYLKYLKNEIKLNKKQYSVDELKNNKKEQSLSFIKKVLIGYNVVINLICLESLCYINYTGKLSIYKQAVDVTMETSIYLLVVNMLLIVIMIHKLNIQKIRWTTVIAAGLLNIGNMFGGTYIYKLWNWCLNNYKEGIDLKYGYRIEYKWTMDEKIVFCHELYKKYPHLLISDKQKIENKLGHTKLEEIPILMEHYNNQRISIIKNISTNEKEIASSWGSTIYEQIENIKQALLTLYTGNYWYIGWGISLGALLVIYINTMQQNNINQQNKIEGILNEIEKLKKKMDANAQKIEYSNEINKYWEHLTKEPDLIKKIAAYLYKMPCIAKKKTDGLTSSIVYKSPFELTKESSALLGRLIELNKKEAQENLNERTKLNTEIHDLGVMYHDLEKIYNKIQPRLDQIEVKVNSRLVNNVPVQDVMREILDKI